MHLKVQIRWPVSEIKICRSLDLLRPFMVHPGLLLSLGGLSWGRLRQPTLSIMLREISGQVCQPCGHVPLAFFQTVLVAMDLHSRSMCSIDSIALQVSHIAHVSYPWMPLQTFSIM